MGSSLLPGRGNMTAEPDDTYLKVPFLVNAIVLLFELRLAIDEITSESQNNEWNYRNKTVACMLCYFILFRFNPQQCNDILFAIQVLVPYLLFMCFEMVVLILSLIQYRKTTCTSGFTSVQETVIAPGSCEARYIIYYSVNMLFVHYCQCCSLIVCLDV